MRAGRTLRGRGRRRGGRQTGGAAEAHGHGDEDPGQGHGGAGRKIKDRSVLGEEDARLFRVQPEKGPVQTDEEIIVRRQRAEQDDDAERDQRGNGGGAGVMSILAHRQGIIRWRQGCVKHVTQGCGETRPERRRQPRVTTGCVKLRKVT